MAMDHRAADDLCEFLVNKNTLFYYGMYFKYIVNLLHICHFWLRHEKAIKCKNHKLLTNAYARTSIQPIWSALCAALRALANFFL